MKYEFDSAMGIVSMWLKDQVKLHLDAGLDETARVLDEVAAAIDAGEVQDWSARQATVLLQDVMTRNPLSKWENP